VVTGLFARTGGFRGSRNVTDFPTRLTEAGILKFAHSCCLGFTLTAVNTDQLEVSFFFLIVFTVSVPEHENIFHQKAHTLPKYLQTMGTAVPAPPAWPRSIW
jgi:hypothetical protein